MSGQKITEQQRKSHYRTRQELVDRMCLLYNRIGPSDGIIMRGNDCLVIIFGSYCNIFSRGYLICGMRCCTAPVDCSQNAFTNNIVWNDWDISPEFWRDQPIIDASNIDNVREGLIELLRISYQEIIFLPSKENRTKFDLMTGMDYNISTGELRLV